MAIDERDLFLRIQQGETALFDQVVERYQPKFLRFTLSKFSDRETAIDMVQEAFVAAFAARGTYRPEFAVSTWLWTILMNLCRRQWKRSQQRQTVSLSVSAEPFETGTQPDGLQKLLLDEQSELLNRLLNELPEPQSDAIRLRFFGDLSFEDIAATMESSLSGAKKRVKQGLLALAERLRRSEELES